MRRSLARLREAWKAEWSAACAALDPRPSGDGAAGDGLEAIETLLQRVNELDRPEVTVPLRGQQTYVRWDRPRGCGLVVTDERTPLQALLALVAAPLLAGNGLVVAADSRHSRLTELLVRALHAGGVPEASLVLAPAGLDLAATVALPAITFAAVDMNLQRAQQLLRALAGASASRESPYLKALISLADGPAPGQAGFLRRFAYPKTVAIRTLHLGAELDLPLLTRE